MSKCVLVMDMPSSCSECPLGKGMSNSIEVCIQCSLGECAVDTETETIPDWCPLKQMPEKDKKMVAEKEYHYQRGYNACIDELLGYNPYQE